MPISSATAAGDPVNGRDPSGLIVVSSTPIYNNEDKNSGPGSSPVGYSGNINVGWWPGALSLPYTTPATAEQAAWTERGKWPTLVVAGIMFLPAEVEFLAPEGGIALGQAVRGAIPYAVRGI